MNCVVGIKAKTIKWIKRIKKLGMTNKTICDGCIGNYTYSKQLKYQHPYYNNYHGSLKIFCFYSLISFGTYAKLYN